MWRGEMSAGFGAFAHFSDQDNNTVVFNYGGYNLNEEKFINEKRLCDGLITIAKSCFAGLEKQGEVRNMPSDGGEMIVKNTLKDIDFTQMLKDGRITIKNCSNCWMCTNDKTDIMALSILYKIFNAYQVDGKVTDYVSYNV